MRTLFLFLVISLTSHSQQSFADQSRLLSYSESKRVFWSKLYQGPGESLYCQRKFEKRYGLNIEHVFAASWMKNQANCPKMNRKSCRRFSPRFNLMEADLHNLYPAKNKLNSSRGNYPFTILEGGDPSPECDLEISKYGVEPAPHARGKIARSILYMEYEYGVNIDIDADSPGQKDLLLYWHCKSPVQEDDLIRNLKIVEIQGTSNPYIDGSIQIDCSKVIEYPED